MLFRGFFVFIFCSKITPSSFNIKGLKLPLLKLAISGQSIKYLLIL